MKARPPLLGLVLLGALALFPGCQKSDPVQPDPQPQETGSVRVDVETTGDDQDNGYTVAIGSLSGSVTANGSVTIANVPVGTASVALGGVATNCTVAGSNPQSVPVAADATSVADFEVSCVALGDADQLLADAIAALEEAMFTALNIDEVAGLDLFSFEDAHDLFEQVLDLEPGNETAAFGAAITAIFMLEDDPGLRAAAEEWEAWIEEGPDPVGPMEGIVAEPAPLRWGRASLPLDFAVTDLERLSRAGLVATEIARSPRIEMAPPPDVSGYRTLFLTVVVPALDEARDHLALITSPGFAFTVTEAMQGEEEIDADPMELDQTEVLILRAGLEVAVAAIHVLSAYSLEPAPLGNDELVAALTPGSTFLQLESDGADLLEEALERLLQGADYLLAALDNLEGETDDQSDDIIKLDPTGTDGATPGEIEDVRSVVTDIDDALHGPTEIVLEEGEPDQFTFMLDARQFFLDPIDDLKAVVPEYEVFLAMEESDEVPVFRWTALNLSDWTFPDPTFNGILPGMTNEDLVDGLQVAELYFEFSLYEGYYRLITIDGVDCEEVAQASATGCSVENTWVQSGSIDLTGSESGPDVYLSYHESTGPPNHIFTDRFLQGTYLVAATAQADEYALSMELAEDGQDVVFLDATLVDRPGYTLEEDAFFRTRGGSQIVFTYRDAVWVFERQR